MPTAHHDEITQQLGRIEAMIVDLHQHIHGHNGMKGHEQRISALERWRAGIVAIVAFISSAVAVLYYLIHAVRLLAEVHK